MRVWTDMRATGEATALAGGFIPVRGMRNLRDLGGYRTADGRRVKRGVLFRSDAVRPRGRAARAAIAGLGLSRVIDFRSASERAKNPDILPAGRAVREVWLPVFDGPASMEHAVGERLRAGTFADIDPRAMLAEAYRQFPAEYSPRFGLFTREVLEAAGAPVLFHCAAGKDRTGFAAAVLLRLLGVPMETVTADYLLSQGRAPRPGWFLLLGIRLKYGPAALRILEGFLRIDAEYLRAAFSEIDARYGSFEAFADEALMIGPKELALLRGCLLED